MDGEAPLNRMRRLFGSLTAEPLTGVQTITVPPGGSTMVDLTLEVPGNYALVDHALSRAMRGLVGTLKVDGPQSPEVFNAPEAEKSSMLAH